MEAESLIIASFIEFTTAVTCSMNVHVEIQVVPLEPCCRSSIGMRTRRCPFEAVEVGVPPSILLLDPREATGVV